MSERDRVRNALVLHLENGDQRNTILCGSRKYTAQELIEEIDNERNIVKILSTL